MTKAKSNLIRVFHNRLLRQFHAVISEEHLAAFAEPPTQFLGLARLRLSDLASQGKVDSFEVFDDRFHRVWSRCKEFPTKRSVSFIIGAGAPSLPGVSVHKVFHGGALAALSITADRQRTATWRPEWLERQVAAEFERLGIDGRVNPADIHAALVRHALCGEEIRDFRLSPIVLSHANGEEKVRVRVVGRRLQVEVVIGNIEPLRTLEGRKQVVERLRLALVELAQQGDGSRYYRLFERHLLRSFKDAVQGPQALGLELPLVLLGGVVLRRSGRDEEVGPEEDIESFAAVCNLQAVIARVPTYRVLPLLRSRGLVEANDSGRVRPTRGVQTAVFKAGHGRGDYQCMALARAATALDSVEDGQRDMQALTLAINEAMLPELRRRLQMLRHQIVTHAWTGPRQLQLFQINLQLFPLTRSKGQESKGVASTYWAPPDVEGGWIPLVLREAVGLTGFRGDAAWLAATLYPTLSLPVIEQTLETLRRRGFVSLDSGLGTYRQTERNLFADAAVGGPMVMNFHRTMIALASQAMDHVPPDECDVSAATVAVPLEEFGSIRSLIIAALSDIFGTTQQCERPEQIYQLNTQFFPLGI